jgi:DNA polymerase V
MRSNRPVPFSEAPEGLFQIPLFSTRISAGFPSPAEDHLEEGIDLNKIAVRNPPATYFLWVGGHSMIGAGIHNGDLAVVDCSLEAKQGDIVVAEVVGEFTMKAFYRVNGAVHLKPANPKYKTIVVTPEMDARIFGVVTSVLHLLNGKRQ